jgi:hypothetical protein
VSEQPAPDTDTGQTPSDSHLVPQSQLSTVVLRKSSGEDPHQGDRLGRFEVHGEIGRGGMGVVLRGHDPALGRDLALKILLKRTLAPK